MKNNVLIFSVVCLLLGLNACKSESKQKTEAAVETQAATVDNSKSSVDWNGTYFGVLPCADCSGIETRITLNSDNTYHISWKYQDKNDELYQKSGTFLWDADGGIITLEGLDKNECPNQYQVGENCLFHLDMDGNRITGDLAPNYVLAKVEQ